MGDICLLRASINNHHIQHHTTTTTITTTTTHILTKIKVQRVINIVMPNNNVEGPLVPELKWLDKLKTLSMPKNKLSGPIPSEWGSMTSLITIDLSQNQISGACANLKKHFIRLSLFFFL
jgi:hypothetical protein